MGREAQASLEYLMTYGWGLVLVATVVAVLAFVTSAPENQVFFHSSDLQKIMVKGGSVFGDGQV